MANFPVDEFFNDEALLDAATIGSSTVYGHFSQTREDLMDANNKKITFAAKTSQVSSVTGSSTLVIGGVTYYVQDIENTGTGITTITLSRNSLNPSS